MTSPAFRCCLLIPTYDNPRTLAEVVRRGRRFLSEVIVVDDGSGAEGRAACERLASEGLAHVVHRERNGGKGAAVKTGFEEARRLGFTHALQVDADGQHDLDSAEAFLREARGRPGALILGFPCYDESAPWLRRLARKITTFWVALEVGRGTIVDAMVGFRVYPLEPLRAVSARGNRMDFDVEIAVRCAWAALPIVNLPVPVRYLAEEVGGVSHFRPLRDNLRLSMMHAWLCIGGACGWLGRRLRPLLGWV